MTLALSSNINNSFNSFHVAGNNHAVVNRGSEILAWLSPLEPWNWHEDIRTRRIDGVGDWLLKTEEYLNWVGGIRGGKSDGSALFCYGGPGVGKSYIKYGRRCPRKARHY